MWTRPLLAVLLLAALTPSGCGPAGVREKTVEIQNSTGLAEARAILERYAKGAPMTSEASDFPQIVDEVRKTDPAKAEILEKGFADLQKRKGNLAPKARELLKKL
jgi:hypothetical protein